MTGALNVVPRLVAICALVLICLSGPGSGMPRAVAAPADPAAAVEGAPVLLLVDTSGSMADDDGSGTVKIEGAKTALLDLLDRLPLDSQVGLRTYPAKGRANCNEGTRAIQIAQRDPGDMAARIRSVTADGDTPTAEALTAAAGDLTSRGFSTGTVVLVSDGHHTCADPCAVAQKLRDGGLGLTVDTVGFRIDDAGAEELRCISGATGGTYTSVGDSAQLGDELARLQGAKLDLQVSGVPTFSPVSEGSLTMTATVTDTSAVTARDVRLALTYDPASAGGAPTVVTPLRLLGNLAPGGHRTIVWTVFPSRLRGSGRLDWTVTLTATGTAVQAKAGVTSLTQELRLDAAGPVLKGAHDVVIVGDSYSSGEGGGNYFGGACHRSPNAWGRQAFPASVAVHNVACSGAVIADYWNTDYQNRWNPFDNVAGQQGELRTLAADGQADVVLLTMGGNDIGFAQIVESCVTNINCADLQLCVPGFCGKTLRQRTEDVLAGLGPQLVGFYRQVAKDSGTDVVVLPYPDLLPNTSRGVMHCTAGLPGFSPAELTFARWVEDELNRQVAAAVTQVAAEGKPISLARDVRTALQPQHTICDRDPWVVQVTDKMLGVGLTQDQVPQLTPKPDQQLVHPTAAGYQAMAAALIRWSHSPAAPKKASRPAPSGPNLLVRTAEGLGQLLGPAPLPVDMEHPLQGGPSVPAGASLQVTSGGYLQGSLVVVHVQSTPQALGSARADEHGRVTVTVRVPENLRAGAHTLTTSGVGADGEYTLRAQPLHVGGALWWPTAIAAAAALALALIGWLLIRLDRSRARQRALRRASAGT